MRTTACIFLPIAMLFISCYVHKNNLKKDIDFDKEVRANEVSFFGPFKYDLSKHGRNTIGLLYKNDSLKYISAGKKTTKRSPVFKILFLSDTLNLIASEFTGRYYTVDTLLFYDDELFWKTIYYEDLPGSRETKIAGNTKFKHYQFMANECRLSTKSNIYHPGDKEPESISSYSLRKRNGKQSGSLIDSSYVLESYQGKKLAIDRFFQRYGW